MEEQAQQTKQMEELMRRLLESTTATSREGDRSTEPSEGRDKLVLSKFVQGEDIEAYLTTFERLMTVYGVN